MLNETLYSLIKTYATESHESLRIEAASLSKDTLLGVFIDLLTAYMNDNNSSALREMVTVKLSGYVLHEKKLGYNGYRQSVADGPKDFCEAKPKNARRDESGRVREKLNANGNISDYTFERHAKNLVNKPTFLLSGFVDGVLIYVIKLPFEDLSPALEAQLNQRFKNRERAKNEYLRSASFSYKDFKNSSNATVVFITPKLAEFQDAINSRFYAWLDKQQKKVNE